MRRVRSERRLRDRRVVEHADERRAGVEGAEGLEKRRGRQPAAGRARVARRQQASRHWDEVGCEQQLDVGVRGPTERPLHLPRVTVREERVGGDVLVRLGVEARRRQATPTPRHARHGINDEPGRLDERVGDERGQRQRGRRRVATGGGDVRTTHDGVGEQLGQAERELVHQVGSRVRLAVPALVHARRQPEVGAQVHDVRDAVDERGGDQLRLAVRECDEGDVDTGQIRGHVRRVLERPVRGGQRRIQVPYGCARVRVGGDVHHLDLRVSREQPEQLGPCVP